MKILLISPLPPPAGGIATWTVKYRTFCENNRIGFSIVNTALMGRRADNITNKSALIDEIKRTKRIISDLKHNISSFKPDIIHINSSCTSFGIIRDYVLIRISKKARIKTILHCRCNIEDQVKSKMSKLILRGMVKNVDAVLVLNSPSFNYIKKLNGGYVKKIPNFIDSSQIVKNKHFNDCIREVLFVGHVKLSKGASELCEVAKRFPSYHFTIVGPLDEVSRSLSWPPNTTLTGAKDPVVVRELMSTADVFLFPTYTEGFSNAVAEAMASGLPIITTDVGANKDMLENIGGITVKPKDVEGLIDSMQRISNVNQRNEMGIWNINKAKQYVVETVMKELLNIYEDILQ